MSVFTHWGTDMTHACGVPIGSGPYLTLHPSSLQ